MKKIQLISFLFFTCFGGMLHAQTWFPIRDDPRLVVPLAQTVRAWAFAFDQVQLLDGPARPYLNSSAAWLLSLQEDKFLAPFRQFAGLPRIADNYVATGPATTGHYLSALSLMFAVTGNQAFRVKVERIVSEMAACQRAVGTGDIPDSPVELWDQVARGDIRASRYGFTLNGVTVPWYTRHKTLAGLLDAWLWTGNALALQVARSNGDWIYEKFAHLTEAQFQAMLECEFGGMEEVLENLYLLTGDEKYRRVARRFIHRSVMDPLSQGRDVLTHLHANTTLPKLLAAARRFQIDGQAHNWTAARISWNSIYDGRTYAMGGTSSWESWQVESGGFPLIDWGGSTRRGPETCISYNLLKMGMHMHASHPYAEWAEDMEHTLWNHILAAWNPDNNGMLYFTPVWPGERKGFHNRDDWFPCCKSSAMESHSRNAHFSWMEDTRGLMILQFVASELTWSPRNLRVRMQTQFPLEDTVRISFQGAGSGAFDLRVRKPLWARSWQVRLNGTTMNLQPDAQGFLVLRKDWREGDLVSLVFRRELRLEVKPDDATMVSLFHGPMVLAALMNAEEPVPLFAGSRTNPSTWLKPVAGTNDWYARATDGRMIIFRPFFQVREERYGLYHWHSDVPGITPGWYEAELGEVLGAEVRSSAAASAGRFVGGIDRDTSRVIFHVWRESAAQCTVWVRYANGTSTTADHRLSWPGGSAVLPLPPTGGWARFDSVYLLLPLPSGAIPLTFRKGAGHAELDRIRFGEGALADGLPRIWEAERGSVHRARIDLGVESASNGGVVGGIDFADSRIVIPGIHVQRAGILQFELMCSNATRDVAQFRVRMGGDSVVVPCAPTGSWNVYRSTPFSLNIGPGEYAMNLARGSGFAQIDAVRWIGYEDRAVQTIKMEKFPVQHNRSRLWDLLGRKNTSASNRTVNRSQP